MGPSQTYTTIAAAINAADGDNNAANYYVITVAPGTYTNDTATVTRPMTIEAAQPGSAVILNETVALPNQKGILNLFRAADDRRADLPRGLYRWIAGSERGGHPRRGKPGLYADGTELAVYLKPGGDPNRRELPAGRRADQQRFHEQW